MWWFVLTCLLRVGFAQATETQDETTTPPSEAVVEEESLKWSGVVIGYPSGSSVDGLGLGVGGQVYARPPSQSQGFKYSMILSLYANLRFDYTHNFLRFQSTGRTSWLGQIGYSGWKNLVYTGNGGLGAFLHRPDREAGNTVVTPFISVAANRKIGNKGWAVIGQHSMRYVYAAAAEGSLLAEDAPLGLGKSTYADFSMGALFDNTDQWPLPHRGWTAEASVRGGFTLAQGAVHPMGSIQFQGVRWQPLWMPRLILGLRLYGERSLGERPFYEKDRAGLSWRDVYGEEQLLLGYGKNRPRGDGALAAGLELRMEVAHHHGKFWDLQAYASVFAEEAWLWDKNSPGPHLPTIGVAPVILFQHAIILRPYIAWGWRADTRNDPRTPRPQFGLCLTDSL